MAVDRKNRDRLAVALAALLRSETTKADFEATVRSISDDLVGTATWDRSLVILLATMQPDPEYDALVEKEALSSAAYRNWLLNERRRILAFLKSDLQLREEARRYGRTLYDCFPFVVARWHTLGFALLFVSIATIDSWSWWLYLLLVYLAGAASLAVFRIQCNRHDALMEKERSASCFLPFFENEQEWLEHDALLKDFNLPSLEPEFSYLPTARPFWRRGLDWVTWPLTQPVAVTVLWLAGECLRITTRRKLARPL